MILAERSPQEVAYRLTRQETGDSAIGESHERVREHAKQHDCSHTQGHSQHSRERDPNLIRA